MLNLSRVGIAIGSNLGDRYHYLLQAEEQLLKLPNCNNFCFSSIWDTVFLGENSAPPCLNAVVTFNTLLTPHELLATLLQIEQQNLRDRSHKNASRTLDLDLLFYGNETISDAKLTIPHPRMQERFFVLTPFAEIEPEWIHPSFDKSIELLEQELAEKFSKENFVTQSEHQFLSNRS